VGQTLRRCPGLWGKIFIDGSCTSHSVPELRRASWSIVEVNDQGEAVKIVRGPVWDPLPQTPQAAEYCALASVPQVITGNAHVYGDCLGVVNLANAPIKSQLSPSLLYSGAFRAGMALASRIFIQKVDWVKAHVLDRMSAEAIGAMDPHDFWKACGNRAADLEAKEALSCHPVMPHDVMAMIDKTMGHLQISLQILSAVLRLWPKLPRGMARMPTGERVGRKPNPKTPDGHVWGTPSRGWVRCTKCWVSRIEGSSKVTDVDAVKCAEQPPLLRQLGSGHDIWLYPCLGDNIVVCRTCGFWGTRKFVELKKQCNRGQGITVGRKRVIERVSRHLHPCDSVALKGVTLDKGKRFAY